MKKNNLLNEIRTATAAHVFRSLNAETGIKWTAPLDVEKISGNYTIRKIENIAAAAGYDSYTDLIILLTRDTANKWRTELNLVTIEAGKANTEHGRCGNGSIYTNAGSYKSSPYSAFFRKADFEDTRKKATAETYLIMQKAAHVSTKGGKRRASFTENERYKLINEQKHADTSGNTYTGSIELQRTTDHGSRTRYEANPGRFYYSRTAWKPESAADMIDKSGYLLHERREDLKRRAAKLRAEKAAKAYQETDDRAKVEEIRGMIENMKAGIIEAFKTANTYEAIKSVESMIDDYKTGLKWIIYSFEQYEENTNAKAYRSINDAERAYTSLVKALAPWQPTNTGKLDTIGENMKAGFDQQAAATTTTAPEAARA